MRQWRFDWLAGLVVGWLVFGSGDSLRASDGGATGILEITFENGTSSVDTLPAWARQVSFDGGALGSRDGRNVWTVDSSRPVGEGRVDIWLHRAELPDALAVVVAFDPLESTDLAIQLYYAQDQVVAVDLFGNLAETREVGGSDTFVIPMRKYPTAARVTIRRIAGPLVLSGLAAFPVIEELNALSQSEEAASERLLARGAASVAGETGSDAGDRGLRIRRERELAISNAIADKVLGAPGYPRARWAPGTVLEAPFSLYVSGTAYRFVTNILMQMYPDSNQLGDELLFFPRPRSQDQRSLWAAILPGEHPGRSPRW